MNGQIIMILPWGRETPGDLTFKGTGFFGIFLLQSRGLQETNYE